MGADVARAWIFGGGQTPFTFDAVFTERHTRRLTITRNPLEIGNVVTDHSFMEPAELQIEAGVGDFSLRAKDANGNPRTDVFTAAARARSEVAWAMLKNLQASAEPFTVDTGIDRYDNMLVAELSALQDAPSANGLMFTALLQESLFVSTSTVDYPPRAPGKPSRQAAKKTTAGEKQATTPDSAAKQDSILFSFIPKDSPAGVAIGDVNPDSSPALKRLLGPGS
jgi:hypothetical protein